MGADLGAFFEAGEAGAFGGLLEGFAEEAAGFFAVVGEGAPVLALDLGVGGDVAEVDGGVGFVDLLAAGSGAFDEALDEVVFGDAEIGEALFDV